MVIPKNSTAPFNDYKALANLALQTKSVEIVGLLCGNRYDKSTNSNFNKS